MIDFDKAMAAGTPPTLSAITAERDKLSTALKRYKSKAIVLLGIAVLVSVAVILYLNANLSGSMDMVILNVAVAYLFVVAMTIHTIGERQATINALEPFDDSEELTDIKNRSAQAAAYLTQLKDRDAVSGEVSLMKALVLEQEQRDAAEAKKRKEQELRRKYKASQSD